METTAAHEREGGGVAVLDDLSRASALLDPERRQLVEALRESPDSASGLARRLGGSRQRLNYHLRALESAGLLEVAEERRRGNCTERVLRVVARRFILDPAALEGLPTEPEAGDRASAGYLIALAARAIRELTRVRARAEGEGKRLATASLATKVSLADPAAMAAFTEDLGRAVAEVVARHHSPGPGSRPFRFIAGVYPAPSPTSATASEELP